MMRISVLHILLIIVSASSVSFAQEPLEALQQGIEEAISVLDDAQYQDASKKNIQQQKLWELMLGLFDFKEFSKRVLGQHWNKFTPQQRAEFVRAFSEFLGKFYLGRLQERYNKERVTYLGQQMIGKSNALVEIEVLWRSMKVPVKLRMTNRSGRWRVYDLSVLGINAVSNYRAQFKWILRNESPQQLIARLKSKIAELDDKS